MKYGLHKMTWGLYFDPNDLETFFSDAAAAGADTLEFRPTDAAMNGDREEIRRIRRLASDNGIEMMFCFAYPPGIDMRSPDPAERKKAVDFLKRGIETAKELGGREIGGVLYANWPTNYHGDMLTKEERNTRKKRTLDCLREAFAYADEIEMPVNIEVINRYEDYTINTVQEGLEFLRAIDCRMCNLILDVYHMNIEEDDICKAILSAKGRIGHFHVSEPNRRIPYHNVRIDWPSIGKALKEAEYDKTVTIEAVVSFDGPSTYCMRLWRDLVDDRGKEMRIEAMRNGLQYIREQFSL